MIVVTDPTNPPTPTLTFMISVELQVSPKKKRKRAQISAVKLHFNHTAKDFNYWESNDQ